MISEEDIDRIAEAVIRRVQELVLVNDLADAIMRKTSQELGEIREAIKDNPYHKPKPDITPEPVTLSAEEAEAVESAKKVQRQVFDKLEEAKRK